MWIEAVEGPRKMKPSFSADSEVGSEDSNFARGTFSRLISRCRGLGAQRVRSARPAMVAPAMRA